MKQLIAASILLLAPMSFADQYFDTPMERELAETRLVHAISVCVNLGTAPVSKTDVRIGRCIVGLLQSFEEAEQAPMDREAFNWYFKRIEAFKALNREATAE